MTVMMILVKLVFTAAFLGLGYDCLEWASRRYQEGLAWRLPAWLALVWCGVAVLLWA